MSILLKQILEQYGAEGQYYDLGKDFSNFHRYIEGADSQITQQFEQQIGSKLVGKRIRARASRGYKQYVKDYEFDVTKVTLEDYYDNYVVVAYDNTTPKPKEYFLKTGFKVQIIGPATGQPSPQKGGKPEEKPTPSPTPVQPSKNPNVAQSQPMALAPPGQTPSEQPLDEEGDSKGQKHYDAYSIDSIAQDVKSWLPKLLLKPNTAIRDFIKGLGWQAEFGHGINKAIFELKIPVNVLKPGVTQQTIQQILASISGKRGNTETIFTLKKMGLNDNKDEWGIQLLKTMRDTTYYE
jgi:molybdopterin converting factor small subunit